MWDRTIEAGQVFTPALKSRIERSHIFVSLITPNSMKRPWVHQETGYALGVSVPVVPLAAGALPGQLMRELQALEIPSDPALIPAFLRTKLDEPAIRQILTSSHWEPLVRSAQQPEARTKQIADYAREVAGLGYGGYGRIRQSGAYSSFCLPDAPPEAKIWLQRDGKRPRSPNYYDLLWEERRILEEHTLGSGCDLILDPWLELLDNGREARRFRLQVLLEFLRKIKGSDARVALRRRLEPGNLLIVGDLFYAESAAPKPGYGYLQTNFSWHAPSVLGRIDNFERHLKHHLPKSGKDSCETAISVIEGIIESLQ